VRVGRIATGVTGATALGVALLSGAPPSLTGCTTHQCDFGCTYFSLQNESSVCGTSTVLSTSPAGWAPTAFQNGDQISWSSSPFLGPWLDFRGNHQLILDFDLPGDDPTNPVPHCVVGYPSADVSADNPTEAGVMHANSVESDGDTVQFAFVGWVAPIETDAGTIPGHWRVFVGNPTCAEYSIRLNVPFNCSGDASAVH
jgi:hypothetical protein